MATAVRMTHQDTGLIKTGYIGFSWTTLFFGFFPPLFRSDFKTFIGAFIVMFIIALVTMGIGVFVASLAWAFMYNKYFTRSLIERGYRFTDTDSLNQQAKAAVGA